MRLYQNGALVGSAAKSGDIDTDPAVSTWMGANLGQTGQVFDGRIDEVKVYRRALTAEEISNEMYNPAPPPRIEYDYDCSAGPMGERQGQGALWLLIALGLLWVQRRRS
jgi:MYXO-CTERM domain-containing protein